MVIEPCRFSLQKYFRAAFNFYQLIQEGVVVAATFWVLLCCYILEP